MPKVERQEQTRSAWRNSKRRLPDLEALEFRHLLSTFTVTSAGDAGGGSFTAPTSYTVGNGPAQPAIADFNGDGFPDIAIPDSQSGRLEILLNKGDGTFSTPSTSFPTGAVVPNYPKQVVAGDFNGDGFTDLATVDLSQYDSVHVFFGNGNGTFQQPIDFHIFSGSPDLTVGDFNGDGFDDIAVAGYYTYVISWDPLTKALAQSKASSIVSSDQLTAGDFDGDGRLDLMATHSYSGTVSFLKGNGNGTFQSPGPQIPVGANPVGGAVGDFDHDGQLDFAVASQGDNAVSVLLGLGDGTFAPAQEHAVGLAPENVIVADFNGDGISDLATGNQGSGDTSLLIGRGHGNFAPATTIPATGVPGATGTYVAAADFNGDGQQDLAQTTVSENDLTIRLGELTLRQAIQQANALPGLDTIDFKIAGAGPHVISVQGTPLPPITDPVVIDGYSQPGSRRNSLAGGDDAILQVVLSGAESQGPGDGLDIDSSRAGGSIIQGLVINQFAFSGINVYGTGSGVQIRGNFIGTDSTGTIDQGNLVHGIQVSLSPTGVTIGGTTPADRNIISGNDSDGILITKATGNTIAGNFIGTDRTGLAALGNGAGIQLGQAASGNTIGGSDPAARNVISGNASEGISLSGQDAGRFSASDQVIENNFLGTDATGHAPLPNLQGIVIADYGLRTTIRGNLISGNESSGVEINAATATGTQLVGNRIGTNLEGTAPVPNGDGVRIFDSSGNTIGGTTNAARNLISGNTFDGIAIFGDGTTAAGNLIQGNFIGTDLAGSSPLGNRAGIHIQDAPHTIIGPVSDPTSRTGGNLISGNRSNGIEVGTGVASATTIQGNTIGLNETGDATLPNAGNGILLASSNSLVSGNAISGNGLRGILIDVLTFPNIQFFRAQGGAIHTAAATPSEASGNRILGNFIGTNFGGEQALGNFQEGIAILGSSANIIGLPGAGNVISANGLSARNGSANGPGAGIRIAALTFPGGTLPATKNIIQANKIGTDASGTRALPNQGAGISVQNANGNTIGPANTIGFNLNGIEFSSGATANVVQGNFIGTDRTGTVPMGNHLDGVQVDGSNGNTIGVPGLGNLIAGNQVGVYLFNGASGNTVQSNVLGTLTGNRLLGNSSGGVLLAGANSNTIGGSMPVDGNVIAGNPAYSGLVLFLGSTKNTVAWNTIANNGQDGVFILNSPDNHIGIAGGPNSITGNGFNGVDVQGAAATLNTIQFNRIMRNKFNGIYVFNAPGNVVGGSGGLLGNVITGSGFSGVEIEGAGAVRNTLQGNTIIACQGYGVLLFNATRNTVGGPGTASNTIQHNTFGGIQVVVAGFPPSNVTGGNFILANNAQKTATTVTPAVAPASPTATRARVAVAPATPTRSPAFRNHAGSTSRSPGGPLASLRRKRGRH